MAGSGKRTGKESRVLEEPGSLDELELGKLFASRVAALRAGMYLTRRPVGTFRQLWGHGIVKVAIKGQSDYYGWDAEGRHVEIELKMHGGKRSPEQMQWAVHCIAGNARYFLLEQQKNETPNETVDRWIREIGLTP